VEWMFDNLRKGLSELISGLKYKKLSKEEFEEVFSDIELLLLQNDVSLEVVERIKGSLEKNVLGKEFKRFSDPSKIVLDALKEAVIEILDSAGSLDLIRYIRERGSRPFKIVFLGVNGVGKTTTIAKIAWGLKRNRFSVVLACSDTFRAGAIEQIKEWGDRLGVRVITQQYGADPAAVAYDAIVHAESRGIDVVLVDTAGRQHTNINLMDELRKIVEVAEPDLRILVLDSLTGQDAYRQALEFNEKVGVDGVIFTKVDGDTKGGSILTVAYALRKPILYLGVGQGLDDLIPFDKNIVIKNIFH